MVREESKQSPQPQDRKEANPVAANGQNTESMFSPRFKSVAAMAGWDEEAILVATLVVEDTPDRESKQKRRFDLQFKTPPSNSRRKRMVQKRSPVSTPITVLVLDEEQSARQESNESDKKTEQLNEEKKTKEEKRVGEDELNEQGNGVSSVLPCMDKLRDELSCAICLEICFEPSTTSCGHSFCKKCLRSAADKCGKKCPKCRQLISNGRSCTVNTVLWNTIQLLFPQEVEARKAAGALSSREAEHHQSTQRGVEAANARTRSMRYSSTEASNRDANLVRLISRSLDCLEADNQNHQRRSIRHSTVSSRDEASMRRRGTPSQDEDATLTLRLERENLARMLSRDASARRRGGARSENEDDAVLALRLQREEFMEAFRGNHEQQQTGSSLSSARANLRAMASRAINIRMRGRPL